ncbi:hypothetical protein PCANC_14865 [Puccinia coronata f. sp. avenae]|uniref:Uncharacterized protein n=1 Tax=Puccinia coronata f. sp. avenae TaxID=200324 RepID=A0A2N5UNR4_9BASI|nr:hypothetical protein PCANC_14865 [Puccinia coronata f. sp. avenae]
MLRKREKSPQDLEIIVGLWYDPRYVTYVRLPNSTWAVDLAHACEEESNGRHNGLNQVYPLPEETTAGNGLLGTIHNNTAVDMASWEPDNEPDLDARTYDVTNLGFICAAHTSHSTDAAQTPPKAGIRFPAIPKAKTFAPAGHRRSSDTGSNSTSSLLSLGGPCLGGREQSSHPYKSSFSHMCILPASTSRFRVPQTLDDGQLELIQSQCSKWKKEVVPVRSGIAMVSQVWVTVNGQDYMLEEVSGNGLTKGFTTNSPVHISVLLILMAMV